MLLILTVLVYNILQYKSTNLSKDLWLTNLLLQEIFVKHNHLIKKGVDIFVLDLLILYLKLKA